MSEPIAFGELPEDARAPLRRARGRSLKAEAEALQSRPHAWAKIATREDAAKAQALARQIVNGMLAPFADGKFEAAVSGHDVWARYIGPE